MQSGPGQSTDVIIVGGGVIGCAIAYYLCQRRVRVIVIEQGEIGGQASRAAAGLLDPAGPLTGPGPYAELIQESWRLMATLVPELEQLTGLVTGYAQTGGLRVLRNVKRMARFQKRFQAWQALGFQVHMLTGAEARDLEPLLTRGVCAAVYVPEAGQIDAEIFTQALARAAVHSGAQVLNHTTVQHVITKGQCITGVQTSTGETLTCDTLVFASGVWSAQMLTWLDLTIPLFPQGGQMLAYDSMHDHLRHIIFGEFAYIFPRGAEILVGATREQAGFACEVTVDGLTWLEDGAHKFLPSLTGRMVKRAWAGLRPATPDKKPVLGRVPGWHNVWLATGHNSVGVMLSPITGLLLAESIVRDKVAEPLRPFALERFAIVK